MRVYLIASIFLMLCATVSAGSPWYINTLDAQLSFDGSIDIEKRDGPPKWLEATFYIIPQDSFLQDAELAGIDPGRYAIEEDEYGNSYVKFRWQRPLEATLPYSVTWDLNISRLKYAIDDPGTIGARPVEGVRQYLDEDNLTELTPFIRNKAEEIIEGSDSTLEAARRIVAWITNTLVYDKEYWGVTNPAETVFYDRRGVCDEFTNLFIAMVRSQGIPARYVKGIVYSGEEWNFHAWAEINIKGAWLPVDPTYNEVGFVDSSHIALAKVQSDNDVLNSIKWEGNNIVASFGKEFQKVEIRDSPDRRIIDIGLNIPTKIGSPQVFDAVLSIDNLANSYIVASCAINMPQEMLLLDSKEKSVLLSPQGRSKITWSLASPPGLDSDWLHNMPIQVICFPNGNASETVVANPRLGGNSSTLAEIVDVTVLNKSSVLLKVSNKGTTELENVGLSVCVQGQNDSCMTETLESLAAGEKYDSLISGFSFKGAEVLSARIEYDGSVGSATTSIDEINEQKSNKEKNTASGREDMIVDEQTIILIAALVFSAIVISVVISTLRRH